MCRHGLRKHHQWGEIIRNSLVGPDYVRARMDFRWQLYKVAPLEQHADNTAVLEAGLAEEVQGLGGTLFDEVAKSADDIWRRVYHGKTEVNPQGAFAAAHPACQTHGLVICRAACGPSG